MPRKSLVTSRLSTSTPCEWVEAIPSRSCEERYTEGPGCVVTKTYMNRPSFSARRNPPSPSRSSSEMLATVSQNLKYWLYGFVFLLSCLSKCPSHTSLLSFTSAMDFSSKRKTISSCDDVAGDVNFTSIIKS